MNTFPQRINIHISLNDRLLLYVERINAPIVELGFRDICFAPDSPQIPHVTLLMGDVSSAEALNELLYRVKILAGSFKSFNYKVRKPYLVKPNNRFCFLDIVNPENFFVLKQTLSERLSDLLSFDFHGGPENPPHITFGYFNTSQIDLPLGSKELFSDSELATAIEVSYAGIRGSCYESLVKSALNT